MNGEFDFQYLKHIAKAIKEHHITLDVIYQGNKIVLRPLTENDWQILLRWNSDPEVLFYTEGDDIQQYTLQDIQEIYRVTSIWSFCFIIEADGSPIGECWLQKMNIQEIIRHYPGKDCRRIDLMIGEKRFWNRGIGTAVIKMLVKFGFEMEGADMIFGLVGDYNQRSIRAFNKAGFIEIGRTRQPEGSKAINDIQLCITRDKYSLL